LFASAFARPNHAIKLALDQADPATSTAHKNAASSSRAFCALLTHACPTQAAALSGSRDWAIHRRMGDREYPNKGARGYIQP